MKKTKSLFGCIFMLCIVLKVLAQSGMSNYKIVNKFAIIGDNGWDYLASDDESGRLFISHGNMVQVLDQKNGVLIGSIPDTKGVHGIALAYGLNKGYISNGRDSSVTVFDLITLNVLGKIKVTGRNPDAILYDDFSHKVFTFNGGSSNSTVIDANEDTIIGTIKLDGKPEFSVTNGKGKIYVNLEDKSKVSMISSVTLKVEKAWTIAPGEGPSGMAIDIENERLFIVCGNKLMVIVDAESGKVIKTLPIGERVDGVVYDPELKCAYSSNGDGTLTVVKEESKDQFKVIENLSTQKGARTIAVNRATHHLYLPVAEYNPELPPVPDCPGTKPSIKPGTFVILDIQPLH
jgi:DNA-binding beta-propeller fold protein YncE